MRTRTGLRALLAGVILCWGMYVHTASNTRNGGSTGNTGARDGGIVFGVTTDD